jgi:hypothetical protein
MGFFKDLIFGKEDENKSAMQKQAEEQIKENPTAYAQAQVENIPTCNGCGGDIEGKPRIKDHMGKVMYFHKRCWKSMKRGELPKPIDQENKQ